MPEPKTIASIESPLIQGVVDGLLRFAEEKVARGKLASIQASFETSSKITDLPEDTLCLWIKGYEVNEEEQEAGFLGHYAIVQLQKRSTGTWTLSATKHRAALEKHPQRRREAARHPDWGHPILRSIKRGKHFRTVQEAQEALLALHDAYPETSIPTKKAFYLMVYEGKKKEPVQRYVFEVAACEDGGAEIRYHLNTHIKTPPNTEKQGFFSAKVALSRTPKPPRPENATEE